MRRKELFYYVTWGSNVPRDVHWCVTVDYQQTANDNIVNQTYGFTIDYGKFILISFMTAFTVITFTLKKYCMLSIKLPQTSRHRKQEFA